MSKFNTQGGYFAPQGYMRVDTGGSHEENPNGGVQVGVDPNGVPNMLEEGEPVYKDFVFSDNITAEKEFLDMNHIPVKYAGKLYSKIADDFLSEAEEQPIDSISANGLNAMLGRLASAQEGQKQKAEEEALMQELSKLSPEELAQLETAIAQEAEAQVEADEMQEPSDEGIIPTEMACGGKINRYDKGGKKNWFTNMVLRSAMNDPNSGAVMQASGWESTPEGVFQGDPDSEGAKTLRENLAVLSSIPAAQTGLGVLGNTGKVAAIKKLPFLAKLGIGTGVAGALTVAEQTAKQNERYNTPMNIPIQTQRDTTAPSGFIVLKRYADGGKVNRYDWGDFLNRIKNYQESNRASKMQGKYNIVKNFSDLGISNINDLENDSRYKAFTDYVLNNSDSPEVQDYLRFLDENTPSSVKKLFTNGELNSDWKDTYTHRRNDGLGGIYHFSNYIGASPEDVLAPEELDAIINAPVDIETPTVGNFMEDTPINVPLLRNPKTNEVDLRYLAPAMDAALGLGVLATPPDHYDFTPIKPYLPQGRIRQRYERYNPLDINLATNQVQSQANATSNAIRNSGLGPSTGANLIGADYVYGQNLGNALASVWDANNQRYNQVRAFDNAVDKTIGDFDWNVDLAKAYYLNQFAPQNQRMGLMVDEMNNQAEQEKYNALSSYLRSGRDALSAIGRENMNRNMVNSNRALLGYGIDKQNRVVYDKYGKPTLLSCGGKLKKK